MKWPLSKLSIFRPKWPLCWIFCWQDVSQDYFQPFWNKQTHQRLSDLPFLSLTLSFHKTSCVCVIKTTQNHSYSSTGNCTGFFFSLFPIQAPVFFETLSWLLLPDWKLDLQIFRSTLNLFILMNNCIVNVNIFNYNSPRPSRWRSG